MFLKINWIIFCYLGLPAGNAVTHSLRYLFTAVSGDISIPEFTIVGQVDHDQFMYFDSDTQKAVPTADWFKDKEDAAYWEGQTQTAIGTHQKFKADIKIAMDRFNQSKSPGVHSVQYLYGCEWDDETDTTDGIRQHGYDGEDFLVYDMKTFTWTSPNQKAEITQRKWNHDKFALLVQKNYITNECVKWLKRYVHYRKNHYKIIDAPEVSVFQRSSSSSLTCLATGFYPSGVMISWRKDGEDQQEYVDLGESLPNPDGTYQIRSTLSVSPEQLENHKYECVVDHKSLEKEMVKTLGSVLPVQMRRPNDSSTGLMIGVAVGLLVLIICIVTGIILWKRKNNKGFIQAKSSDNGSDNSGSNKA